MMTPRSSAGLIVAIVLASIASSRNAAAHCDTLNGPVVSAAIKGADRALETGSVDDVVKLTTERAAAGIRQRFALAQTRQKHADESVSAGRDYVKAYVEFIHYVEQLHLDITGAALGKDQTAPAAPARPGSR